MEAIKHASDMGCLLHRVMRLSYSSEKVAESQQVRGAFRRAPLSQTKTALQGFCAGAGLSFGLGERNEPVGRIRFKNVGIRFTLLACDTQAGSAPGAWLPARLIRCAHKVHCDFSPRGGLRVMPWSVLQIWDRATFFM